MGNLIVRLGFFFLLSFGSAAAFADRVKDIATLAGVRTKKHVDVGQTHRITYSGHRLFEINRIISSEAVMDFELTS